MTIRCNKYLNNSIKSHSRHGPVFLRTNGNISTFENKKEKITRRKAEWKRKKICKNAIFYCGSCIIVCISTSNGDGDGDVMREEK